ESDGDAGSQRRLIPAMRPVSDHPASLLRHRLPRPRWREWLHGDGDVVEATLGIEDVGGRVPGAGVERDLFQVFEVQAAPFAARGETAPALAGKLVGEDVGFAVFGAEGVGG